jgi:hypothetical protein
MFSLRCEPDFYTYLIRTYASRVLITVVPFTGKRTVRVSALVDVGSAECEKWFLVVD